MTRDRLQLSTMKIAPKLRNKTMELQSDLLAEGLIVPPGKAPDVTSAERTAIAAYLATKAPRHFANADSGDDFHLCAMLRTRGHKIFRTVAEGHRSIKYNLDGVVITRAAFVAFVDALRASTGLPPIGSPA